ncbi:hypothetical protein BLA29_001079 [Euroglyphus maynei]|uniref:Uncharacterized protein n=1 Tax=Euroglyphus maynei TaxID=6958 RepID=A0A1Y3BHV5_EURMA|nr:hypothetical protein BLA29_001079 [Euroglyphus maynei]
MDSLHRLQEEEGYPRHNSTSSNGEPRLSYGSPGRGSSSGLANGFLVDSLRRSVDMPAYMQWQTLSTDVSIKLRNIVEWAQIDEQHEKTPLLDRSTDKEGSIRYADINCNETAKPSGKW